MKRARCPAILSALLVALFLAACAPPPTGTVSGYVVNRKAGTPVAGTRVRAEGSNASTVTDDAGFYSLTVPAGDVALVFSQEGYAVSRVEGLRVAAEDATHYDTVQARIFDPFLPTEAPNLALSIANGSSVSVNPEDDTFRFEVTGSVAHADVNGFTFASAALSHSLGNSSTLNASIPGTPIVLGEDGNAKVVLSAAGFDGPTTLHVVAYDENNNRVEVLRYLTVRSAMAAAKPAAPTALSGLAVTFGDTSVFGPLEAGRGYSGRELLDAFAAGDMMPLAQQSALMQAAAKGHLGTQGFLDEAVTWVDLVFDYPVPDAVVTRADLAANRNLLPAAFEVFRTIGDGDETSIGRIDAAAAAAFVDPAGTVDPSDDLLAGFQYRDATPGLQAGQRARYRVEAVTGDQRESSDDFSVTPLPPFYVSADRPGNGATGVSLQPSYRMSFENRDDLVLYGVLVLDRVQAENNVVDWLGCCAVDATGTTSIEIEHNADGTATTPTLQPFHAYDWAPAAITTNGSFEGGAFTGVTAISIAADFYLLGERLGSMFGVELGVQDGPVNTFVTGNGSP